MRALSRMLAVLLLSSLAVASFLPGESNQFGLCLHNCALCKKVYGDLFAGQLCADACVQFKGKIIPDCEDLNSIAPFMNKLE